ncbi:MAG: hypothetical protein ACYTEX_18930 [Planctomycetota bacterium]|jgi:hypothetical protein
MNFLPLQLYCTPSYATITTGGNANGGSVAVTDLRTVTISRFEHLGIRVLNPSAALRTGLFRISSFGFRASTKGVSCQKKCQAKVRPQGPITTLYLSFDPNTLIKKAPFRRKFGARTNPHNAPKIAILLIEKDLTPVAPPKTPLAHLKTSLKNPLARLKTSLKTPLAPLKTLVPRLKAPLKTTLNPPNTPPHAPEIHIYQEKTGEKNFLIKVFARIL